MSMTSQANCGYFDQEAKFIKWQETPLLVTDVVTVLYMSRFVKMPQTQL